MTMRGIIEGAGRPGRIHHIRAGRPFADDLAAGVRALAPAPEDLADAVILLPSRRLAAALRAAFLRELGGASALLPRMLPLGDPDIDEAEIAAMMGAGGESPALRPPIAPVVRELMLAIRLVDSRTRPGEALSLAATLADFLDAAQSAGCDMEKLAGLMEAGGGEDPASLAELSDLAEHWQKLMRLLSLLVQYWPLQLERLGKSDPVRWRDAAIGMRGEAWKESPPKGLVVIAGSTGSIAATRGLMRVVLGLPRGHVVLPGLDTVMDEEDWESLTARDGEGMADPSAICHPQYQLACLLAELGIAREDVAAWPYRKSGDGDACDGDTNANARLALLAEIFRPASRTGAWQKIPDRNAVTPASLKGLRIAECADGREEAEVIALAMRGALEVPGRRAALVTADRVLARMVAGALSRWGIRIEDSSGRALGETAPAVFLRLIAAAWAADFAPLPLCAMLRHPLAAGGGSRDTFRRMARRVDMELLRGAARPGGLAGLARHARRRLKDTALADFVESRIIAPLAPLQELAGKAQKTKPIPLADFIAALARAGENMAAREDAPLALWHGHEGIRCARFVQSISEAIGKTGTETGADTESALATLPEEFPTLLARLFAREVIHTTAATHPRLAILGTVEARMHDADLLILGGMNEGTSPPRPEADPWMSNAMRARFGLPPPHWRSGPAAHDAYMAMAAGEVFITRARRSDGAPTEKSRWLRRLDAVLDVARCSLPVEDELPRLAARLSAWEGAIAPIAPPARPLDAALRPRAFSATELDTLRTDPYAIYARRVLGLAALDPLDTPPGAAERGSFIHAALGDFIAEFPQGALPADAMDTLLAHGRRCLGSLADDPWAEKFWWPQFEAIAAWFIENERARAAGIKTRHAEITGAMEIEGLTAPYTITARADRIDVLADGRLRIVDYKTGTVPEKGAVRSGRALQLIAEAMLAQGGHFEKVAAGEVAALEYWRLTGRGDAAGEVADRTLTPAEAAAATEKLIALLHEFDCDDAVYESERDKTPNSDYRHLARAREWRLGDGYESGGGESA